jgi:hypothetical protein
MSGLTESSDFDLFFYKMDRGRWMWIPPSADHYFWDEDWAVIGLTNDAVVDVQFCACRAVLRLPLDRPPPEQGVP